MNSNPENKDKWSDCCRGYWHFPFVILAIVAVKSALVLGLWNWLIPELFHGPVVNYLQAVGIVVLTKLLLWHGPRHHGHGRFGGSPWKRRWEKLSPEEREKLKEEIRKCCE